MHRGTHTDKAPTLRKHYLKGGEVHVCLLMNKNSYFGYEIRGRPVPESPLTKLIELHEAWRNRGSLKFIKYASIEKC